MSNLTTLNSVYKSIYEDAIGDLLPRWGFDFINNELIYLPHVTLINHNNKQNKKIVILTLT